MRPLDLHRVQEPRRTTQQRPSGECQLGQGVVSALVESSRAVGDALAAFQLRSNLGVMLVPLELFVPGETERSE